MGTIIEFAAYRGRRGDTKMQFSSFPRKLTPRAGMVPLAYNSYFINIPVVGSGKEEGLLKKTGIWSAQSAEELAEVLIRETAEFESRKLAEGDAFALSFNSPFSFFAYKDALGQLGHYRTSKLSGVEEYAFVETLVKKGKGQLSEFAKGIFQTRQLP